MRMWLEGMCRYEPAGLLLPVKYVRWQIQICCHKVCETALCCKWASEISGIWVLSIMPSFCWIMPIVSWKKEFNIHHVCLNPGTYCATVVELIIQGSFRKVCFLSAMFMYVLRNVVHYSTSPPRILRSITFRRTDGRIIGSIFFSSVVPSSRW